MYKVNLTDNDWIKAIKIGHCQCSSEANVQQGQRSPEDTWSRHRGPSPKGAFLQAAVKKCCDRGIVAVQDHQQQQGSDADDDNMTAEPVSARMKLCLEFLGELL